MIGRLLEAEVISLHHFRHWHDFQRVMTEAEWCRALKAIDMGESIYLDEAVASSLCAMAQSGHLSCSEPTRIAYRRPIPTKRLLPSYASL